MSVWIHDPFMADTYDWAAFRERVRQVMAMKGLNPYQLEKQGHLSNGFVGAVLDGKMRHGVRKYTKPGLDALVELAAALGVEPGWLVFGMDSSGQIAVLVNEIARLRADLTGPDSSGVRVRGLADPLKKKSS